MDGATVKTKLYIINNTKLYIINNIVLKSRLNGSLAMFVTVRQRRKSLTQQLGAIVGSNARLLLPRITVKP